MGDPRSLALSSCPPVLARGSSTLAAALQLRLAKKKKEKLLRNKKILESELLKTKMLNERGGVFDHCSL